MDIKDYMKNANGVVTVQIEGFFTERFINLCKIRNIKIWDIRNVVSGVVRFKTSISDFKKLPSVAKKTKCKVKIKDKKGIYFALFKYRKRKVIFALLSFLIIFSILFSTFIWNIDISGSDTIKNEEILQALKETNMYIGKTKIGVDKTKVISTLRVLVPDIAWAGLEFKGTTAKITIVEKTKLKDQYIQKKIPGDIVANKSGVITKIIAESGTAKFKVGSFVEKGNVLIEGMIYSKFLEPTPVVSKGFVNINSEYVFNKKYEYISLEKEYTAKKRYVLGISINSKEIMLNYLNKSKKYDISKNENVLNIFNTKLSFNLYCFNEYMEKEVKRQYDQLIYISKLDAKEFLEKEIIPNAKNYSLIDEKFDVQNVDDGIEVTLTYTVNEQIGEYVERNS